MTNIIAPAVKDKIKGSIVWIFKTKSAPIQAKIGSTKALKEPNRKDFHRERFSRLIGKLIALPSGKFWIAIPIVNAIAEAREMDWEDYGIEA